ncbi:MAG TPA: SRPBCC domain-containing protein [Opitutaceae bacterium]
MNENMNSDRPAVVTRRQAIAGAAAAIGSLAAGARAAGEPAEAAPTPTSPARASLHYEASFNGGPERIYGVLTDPKQFAAMTGRAAVIDATEGGAFSLFGGLIVGRNVELVPGRRVVQAWRPTHWDAGVYSIVKFEFTADGATTKMALDHTGFPVAEADSLDSGWKGHYLGPLSKFLS